MYIYWELCDVLPYHASTYKEPFNIQSTKQNIDAFVDGAQNINLWQTKNK